MRKFFLKAVMLLLAMTTFNVQSSAQQDYPELYGLMRYSPEEYYEMGLYNINPMNGGTLNCVWSDYEMLGNGGAVYANGKYYVLSFLDYGGGMLFASYLVCDIDNQTYEYTMPEIDFSYLASDLTYDATNNTVYACSMDASGDGSFWLSRMNLETAAKEGIAKMPQMAGIAANPEGVLYGIGMDGILYTINKNTAELTEIGATGVTPVNDQSATFDPETGVLYWSAYTEQGGSMYTVDTTTGAATLYCTYPNGEQISGLFIKQAEVSAGIPASVENMTFDFKKDELSGTVSFTLPTKDTEGNELTGVLTYGLSIDNSKPLTSEGNPGEVVSYTVNGLSEGVHTFIATVKNSVGAAVPLNVDKYIGMDIPAAPVEVIAKVKDNCVVLSWKMNTRGENDGYIDMSKLRYNILRRYDNVTIATDLNDTTFTDTFENNNIRICRYEITPSIGLISGNYASSEDVTVGEYMNVPFEHNLANKGDYMLYTVLDANADKDSWEFALYPEYSEEEPCATYLWTVTETNDDWLFSPYVYLEAGKSYEAKYSLRSEDDIFAGDIEVMLGREKVAEGMSTISGRQPVDHKDFRWLTTESFTVSESGKYVLGLHVCGNRSKYYIYLNGINVYENGTTGISSGNTCTTAYVQDGTIYVNNAAGEKVSVFNASGICVLESTDMNINLNVPAGLYIVRTGEKVMKFMVK